ncbi:uncharacterized protein LOC125240106 [Leguminivora glycinivorella]|uniref:uncharacterized protein LOC125240106 n=1 Tax=Leguminivora glycinivorella TaxID=1035111 RepID=UPI00200EF63B|nr:uncharacterized protein LOC125240106 [Leguminivora glycinivorella]
MVNTRSTTRRERERKEEELKQATVQQPQTPVKDEDSKKLVDKTIILETGSQIKPEHSGQTKDAKPLSHCSRKTSYHGSKKSSSSSIVAQRKKLELEAAEAKARIQMDLIEKKLQVDLANLEEEYSPSEESVPSEQDHQSVKSDVARWVERSQLELESQHVPKTGNNPDALCSSAAVVAGTELPVQQLASALKELATVSASNNTQNARLLSRISTPKELPLFYGEPMEWLQFKQAFEESTRCLLSHHDRQSCTAAACDVEGCGQAHHGLLHYVPGQSSRSNHYNVVEVSDTSAQTETVTHIDVDQRESLLKVVPIYLHGPNGKIKTTCMLDDGSGVSFISTELAERAGLRGRKQCVNVRGAWLNSEQQCETQLIDCSISNNDGTKFNLTARIAPHLDLPVQNPGLVKCGKYKYLDRIMNYVCAENQKPEILIGQDNYHLHVPREIIEGSENEPYATRTPLGWCVHGPCQRAAVMKQRKIHTSLHLSYTYEQDMAIENNEILRELQEDMRRSFSIDSMGVSAKPRQNSEDVLDQEHLEQTSELIDGQWQVGLPWKDPHCVTVDSYPNALSRLKGVELKMKRSEEYARRYKERIQHLLENKYAEKLENQVTSARTWYLPTHGVDNPNKKSLRLVFDGSAKTKGFSLNSYLYKGPDLLVPLIGIMWRFRENKVAISGDIKDMFLRVKIKPEDQQALRFLYRDNPEEPIDTYLMTSLIFGANCAPFIAQFIKNKNVRRFESTYPEAANAIYTQHYVDDYIDSLPDDQSAIKLVRDVTYVHAQGDFHIRNWNSNSQAVINSIPKETLGSSAVRFKVGQQYAGERTLGLLWNPSEDTLGTEENECSTLRIEFGSYGSSIS